MPVQPSESERLAQRSALVDSLVNAAARETDLPATVVAAGGYGRRELFPFSDVDLLLLVDGAPEPGARARIAAAVRSLWDAGLRASQSVHTIEECCEVHEGNLELTISLLDKRFVAGDAPRYKRLEERFARFLAAERSGIVRHLCLMTRGRHERFGGTIYQLEPNIKEAPGGLRDLHVLDWLRLLGVGARGELGAAREFLFAVRRGLHTRSGRDNNLLDFDAQDALASAAGASAAEWMREYYLHARAIFRAVCRAIEQAEEAGAGLLSQFRSWRGRLSNSEFTVARDRVLLREPGLFQTDANAPFRLLEFVARHQLALAPGAERHLAVALAEIERLGGASWKQLRAPLALPGCAAAFRALHEAGLMPVLLSEWKRIDALVTRDFHHRYTVDEHTLVALESLAGLARATDSARARFSRLLSEAEDPASLHLALLLHDIGKGGGTGDHSSESLRIARAVLERLRAPATVRDMVEFLIEHHLDLSGFIQSRDLEDPATAQAAAASTGSIERLRLLTLETYADISAVNPAAMSPWHLDQLWRLYVVTHNELTRELDSDRIHAAPAGAGTALFLEGMPTRYARTHSADEIAAHVALAGQAAASGAATNVVRENGYWRTLTVARDRPGLFADLSGAIAGFGLNIWKAEASSNAAHLALNSFTFSDPHRTLELNPPELDRLIETLELAALGLADIEAMLGNRPQPKRDRRSAIPVAVTFNEQASQRATLVEIAAADRPGLLYDLAHAIASVGLNIEVVLVHTEARRAFDVFYVSRGGEKLDAEARDTLRARLVEACG